MNIQDRIIKTQKIEWRKLKWFQADLKEITQESFDRLKHSIINNGFSSPFHVWFNGKSLYILDGHHRQKALEEIGKEGHSIPGKLTANFIKCSDKKDAAKMVVLFASTYAYVTDEGYYKFLNEYSLDFDELKLEFDLPEFDELRFEEGYIIEPNFNPATEMDQGRLDQKSRVKCPECGLEFVPI